MSALAVQMFNEASPLVSYLHGNHEGINSPFVECKTESEMVKTIGAIITLDFVG